ncbi:unnamed protein product, partial [Polarella glacialis]
DLLELEKERKAIEARHVDALQRAAKAGHQPLFLLHVLEHFAQVSPNRSGGKFSGTYVDCTFGRGGHSRELLSRMSADSKLIALDVDPESVAVGRELEQKDHRFTIFHSSFADLAEVLDGTEVQGVLINSGFTTAAKKNGKRGIMHGVLDLRFNQQ